MKIKEFFGFSSPETTKETGADSFEKNQSKTPAEDSANKEVDRMKETEDKYMKELDEYRRHAGEETLRIENEFEKIKTATPEEFARLKEKKDLEQELLRENLRKVKMNLEEGLTNHWRTEEGKEIEPKDD